MIDNPSARHALKIWRIFLWSLGLGPALLALFWPRSADLSTYVDQIGSFGGGTELAEYIGKGSTIALLGVSSWLCWMYRSRFFPLSSHSLLWISCLALSVGLLAGGAFGTVPGLTGGMLLYLTALSAACVLPPIATEILVREIKNILRVYLYSSLVAALVAPSWAMTIPYTEGYIPGFEVRLHGIIVHGLQLAYLLTVLLLLDLSYPSECHAGLRMAERTILVMCLILTQAKTMWVLLPVGLLILVCFSPRSQSWLPSMSPSVKAVIGLWIASAIGAAYLTFGIGWFMDLLGDSASRLSSLTGRTTIWSITLDLWRENPLFGYGPWLWDFDMGLANLQEVGMAASQSHNQFVQSLGQSGLIGLCTLCFHLCIVLGLAFYSRKESRGVILAITIVCVLRGLSEAWIRRGVSDGNFFIHVCIVALLAVAVSRTRSTAHASSPPLS